MLLHVSGRRAPTAIAFGFVTMIRADQYATVDRSLRSFIDARSRARDGQWIFLHLADAETARFGDEAALIGLVLLERSKAAKSVLDPVRPAEALSALLMHGQAAGSYRSLLPKLAKLAGSLPAYRLRFSRFGDAAAKLMDAFPQASSLQPSTPRQA